VGVLIILGRGFKVPLHRALKGHIVEGGAESLLILGFLIGISPCAPLVAILTCIAYTATNVLSGMIYASPSGWALSCR